MTSSITQYFQRIKSQRRRIKRKNKPAPKPLPITPKIFPFSPGIVWKTQGNYIVPEVHPVVWETVLEKKDPVVICHGGLLESFYSLSYIEAISSIYPKKNISWIGDPEFNHLIKAQGLAKVSDYNIDHDLTTKYPTPVFMDAENRFYFNTLLNYIETQKIIKTKKNFSKINTQPIIKQILQNSLLEYDNYNPKFRSVNSFKYDSWIKSKKNNQNHRYALIFQDVETHGQNCLDWNDRQIRELSELLRHLNITVICCQDNSYDIYKNTSLVVRCPLDIEINIELIKNAYVILSNTVDYLLVALAMSDAMIFSKELTGVFNLNDNADFISSDNIIFTDNDLNPRTVFQILENL